MLESASLRASFSLCHRRVDNKFVSKREHYLLHTPNSIEIVTTFAEIIARNLDTSPAAEIAHCAFLPL